MMRKNIPVGHSVGHSVGHPVQQLLHHHPGAGMMDVHGGLPVGVGVGVLGGHQLVGMTLQNIPGLSDHGGGMVVPNAQLSDISMMTAHHYGADLSDIALAQPVKRLKRIKKSSSSRNATRCPECGCAVCMRDRQQVAKSSGESQKPCQASEQAKLAWIEANDGQRPLRPSRSKVPQCVQCNQQCWRNVASSMKKGRAKKLAGIQKPTFSRSSRRCKDCGCALCEGKSPAKDCQATPEQRIMWLQANGGKPLLRPSRSKMSSCVRCTERCWEMTSQVVAGQRRRTSTAKKAVPRTRKNRRCKICGCANCDGRSTGACSASQRQKDDWIAANGNRSLSRPARSKVDKCTRCGANCWSQGDNGAPLNLVTKKGRGRNYRSKMRCKMCGCAVCVARRPPKDTNCDANEGIQQEWLALNGDKLPARPSRSKAKSCLRCEKNCWRIGPEARKKVGEAVGPRKTRRSVRRCKICGCAECSGRSSGMCNASPDDQARWKDANGGKELIRPARSKVEVCTRCNKKCWTKKPTPKRKRGRKNTIVTRNHRRCKKCGCANCDGKTSGVCTGTEENHKAWVDANDTITLTRPSRSKVTRCTRCDEACWVNDGTARKRPRNPTTPTADQQLARQSAQAQVHAQQQYAHMFQHRLVEHHQYQALAHQQQQQFQQVQQQVGHGGLSAEI